MVRATMRSPLEVVSVAGSASEQRTELVDAVRRLFDAGVMSHSGHANASARLPDERMLMTSSGTVNELTPDGLAIVRDDGTPVDGEIESTVAEIVPMHAAVYQARPTVGSVIHPALSCWPTTGCSPSPRHRAKPPL